jgi:chromosome segregation ATPase
MTQSEYEQLVAFLGRHFEAIDQRFEALEHRVERGFGEMLGHLEAIYGRLERLEQEYHAIVQALRRIETLLADERGRREILERGLADLKRQVAALQARIEEIEHRLSG